MIPVTLFLIVGFGPAFLYYVFPYVMMELTNEIELISSIVFFVSILVILEIWQSKKKKNLT